MFHKIEYTTSGTWTSNISESKVSPQNDTTALDTKISL